jgi:hypothetical protein
MKVSPFCSFPKLTQISSQNDGSRSLDPVPVLLSHAGLAGLEQFVLGNIRVWLPVLPPPAGLAGLVILNRSVTLIYIYLLLPWIGWSCNLLFLGGG